MHADEPGVPPLAFTQMLNSSVIDREAAARFRTVMAREGTDETALLARDQQAPLRWFREVYPDLDTAEATKLGFAFAEHSQLTSFGPLSLPLVSAGSVAEIVEAMEFFQRIPVRADVARRLPARRRRHGADLRSRQPRRLPRPVLTRRRRVRVLRLQEGDPRPGEAPGPGKGRRPRSPPSSPSSSGASASRRACRRACSTSSTVSARKSAPP